MIGVNRNMAFGGEERCPVRKCPDRQKSRGAGSLSSWRRGLCLWYTGAEMWQSAVQTWIPEDKPDMEISEAVRMKEQFRIFPSGSVLAVKRRS